MTQDEWKSVVRLVSEELWPASKEWTPETILLLKQVVFAHSCERVTRLLRQARIADRFPPSLASIQASLRADSEAAMDSTRHADDQAEMRRLAASWAKVRQVLSDLTPEELERHKAQVIADDPKARHTAHLPATSKLWLSTIYSRVTRGLLPDQPDEDRIQRYQAWVAAGEAAIAKQVGRDRVQEQLRVNARVAAAGGLGAALKGATA